MFNFYLVITNPEHAAYIPDRSRNLKETFSHFFDSSENFISSNLQTEIKKELESRRLRLNNYQTNHGLEVNLKNFDDFVYKIFWDAMMVTPSGLEETGKIIFGTGRLTSLVINAQMDTLLEENFLAWNDPLNDLKTEILSLGACSDFSEQFSEKWVSWFEDNDSAKIKDDRLVTSFLEKIEKIGNLLPSQYLVIAHIFQFLVDMENNENVDFFITDAHFVHLMDVRAKIADSDFQIDAENVKNSLMTFHVSSISNIADPAVSKNLENLRKFQQKDARLSEFSFKFQIISDLEANLSCDENRVKRSSEDLLSFINELAITDLAEFFENKNERGLDIFMTTLAANFSVTLPNLSVIIEKATEEPFEEPEITATCNFYQEDNNCPKPSCGMVKIDFVDAWKSKRNQEQFFS